MSSFESDVLRTRNNVQTTRSNNHETVVNITEHESEGLKWTQEQKNNRKI